MTETYAIVTYGCQMNDHDSEIMEGILAGRGMRRIDDEREADVVVFNTCCVREGAETRAMARVQALSGPKQRRPGMVIAVTGCVAQFQGQKLFDVLPHADLVVGTRDYPRLSELIDQVRATGERFLAVDSVDKPFTVDALPVRRSPLKAHVNIMYGCNNHCTFCIVPKTRGPEYSRPVEDVVAEVRGLVAQGTREVMLLGQNVNSYRDPERRDFADLLFALEEVEGLWRVRYTTSNPKDARDRHIGAVAGCSKVVEHLHLPVQSGSDRILRLMKRSYNVKRYLYLIDKFRAENPSHALTTDVIVGFPTEADEDFEATMELCRRARWDSAFMFIYSPRPGTPSAETMADDVPAEVKRERLARLIREQEAISAEINQSLVGQTFEVLVEGPSRRHNQLCGRTRTDKTVVFDGAERLIGTLAQVRVTAAAPHTLFGEVATAEPAELAAAR